MHPALLLIDISEVICEFLDNSTLAHLARTCRAFEEPALDALWKIIPGIVPLVRLFPDSAWIPPPYNDPNYSSHRYMLRRPLSPQQWKMMQKYTSRIIVISSAPLDDDAIEKLQTIAVDSPPSMFPKLKEIRKVWLQHQNVTFFHWLNGPSLTKLDMFVDARTFVDSNQLDNFVHNMGNIYPNMKKFSFRLTVISKDHAVRMGRYLSKAIVNWKHLEHIKVNTLVLDTAAYEHLTRLESLTSMDLILTCIDKHIPHMRVAVFPRKPFPNLACLILVADRSVSWIQTAEWLNHFRLHLIDICCKILKLNYITISPETITNLCHTIAAQLCHKSLQTITLGQRPGTNVIVQVDSIRPLFQFSNLRCVKIANLSFTSLSDDDLFELVASWPLLEVLELNKRVLTNAPDLVVVPTFKGFFYLLQHCTRLQELVIIIDARNLEWVEAVHPWDNTSHDHPLSNVCLGNSPLDDAKRVASILWSTLPCLEGVVMDCWESKTLYDSPERQSLEPLWREVNEHLAELRNSRVREDGDGLSV